MHPFTLSLTGPTKFFFAGYISNQIGHFRVPKTLTFKMRLGAQPFLWKWVLFAWEWKWFLYQGLSTYPRFETEARGNTEMAYSLRLNCFRTLAPVVETSDSAIQRLNHYLADIARKLSGWEAKVALLSYNHCTVILMWKPKLLSLNNQSASWSEKQSWNIFYKGVKDLNQTLWIFGLCGSSILCWKLSLVGGFPLDSLAKSGFPLLICISVFLHKYLGNQLRFSFGRGLSSG